MTYFSGKTYTHASGLSCCFRQWRADSHCRFLHGYALQVKVLFKAQTLDVRNWVVDFGSLKGFKAMLEASFDHKLIVAEDDPDRADLEALGRLGLAQVIVMPNVGCEAFAEYVYGAAQAWLEDNGYAPRVSVHWVEIAEHDGNRAIYQGNVP